MIPRARPLALGALALVLASSLAAGCLFTSADDCTLTLGFGEACSGASGSGAGSGGSKDAGHPDAPIPCSTASDCPDPPEGPCHDRGKAVCKGGACALEFTPGDATTQRLGDCRRATCDAAGTMVEVNDDGDPHGDGNVCTTDSCAAGVVQNVFKGAGAPCSTTAFDGWCQLDPESGVPACVVCREDADCSGTTPKCERGQCVPDHCTDGVRDLDEPSLDCGGVDCAPCLDGKPCNAASDCASGVCMGLVCQAPECNDGVKNGVETALDCGGFCSPCADGDACAQDSDCQSGVCAAMNVALSECAAPLCTDGVKNGMETGVDCGGLCAPCGP